METLEVRVSDIVFVTEGSPAGGEFAPVILAYFQPEFVFTMDKDVEWAPARSRAPSVLIEFDLVEAPF